MSPPAARLIAAGVLACATSCSPVLMRDSEWNDRPPPAACEVVEASHPNDDSSVVRLLYDPAGRLIFGIRKRLDGGGLEGGGGTGVERFTWQGPDLIAAEYLEERREESCAVCKCYGDGCGLSPASRTIVRDDLEWRDHRPFRVRHTSSYYEYHHGEGGGWRLRSREASTSDWSSKARWRDSTRLGQGPRIEWYQGRVSVVDYGNGQSTIFGYDQLGRCVFERQVSIEQRVFGAELGQPNGIARLPDVVTRALTREYDQHGKLLRESVTVNRSLSVGEESRSDTHYGYDSVGRVIDISTNHVNGPGAGSITRKTTTYSDGCPARVGALTEAERAVNSVPAQLGLMACYRSPGGFYVACFERD